MVKLLGIIISSIVTAAVLWKGWLLIIPSLFSNYKKSWETQEKYQERLYKLKKPKGKGKKRGN